MILESIEYARLLDPDKVAVRGSHQTLTRQDLFSAMQALLPLLDDCTTLGLCMKNSPAWIITDLAAISAGITNIPLPVFFSDAQLQHTVMHAHIDTIITDQPQRLDKLSSIASSMPIDIAGIKYTLLRLSQQKNMAPQCAKVTYTSGSTGTPRGVRLSMDCIESVSQSLKVAAEANENDRSLVVLPLSILLENIGSVYVPLLAGAEIIVPDADELGIQGSSQIDPVQFATALKRIQPNTLIVPPGLLKLLVGLAQNNQTPDSFRFIAVGGAPVGRALLDAAERSGLPVYQGYGLSECGSVVSVNTAQQHRLGSVGKPLPHSNVRIDEDGEIYIGGTLFEGYLNDNPRQGNEIASGDLGYFDDDGYLFVTGRSRHRIITDYGRNISPEWIESELIAHSRISQAAVFGEQDNGLFAIVVPTSGSDDDQVTIAISQVNAGLPDYARIDAHLSVDTPFSLGNGQLSAGNAPIRNVIEQAYKHNFTNKIRASL